MSYLRIKNFRCIKNKKIKLPETGIFFISGKSGAGKTTIMQAIAWLFYNKVRQVQPFGKKSINVTVRYKNKKLIIERQRNPILFRVKDLINDVMYKNQAAQDYIDSIYGDYDVWLSSSYLQQKEFCYLLTCDQVSKINIVEQLSLITDSRSTIEKIKVEKKRLLNEIKINQEKINVLKDFEVEKVDKVEEIEEVEFDKEKLSKTKTVLDQQLIFEKRYNSLQERKTNLLKSVGSARKSVDLVETREELIIEKNRLVEMGKKSAKNNRDYRKKVELEKMLNDKPKLNIVYKDEFKSRIENKWQLVSVIESDREYRKVMEFLSKCNKYFATNFKDFLPLINHCNDIIVKQKENQDLLTKIETGKEQLKKLRNAKVRFDLSKEVIYRYNEVKGLVVKKSRDYILVKQLYKDKRFVKGYSVEELVKLRKQYNDYLLNKAVKLNCPTCETDLLLVEGELVKCEGAVEEVDIDEIDIDEIKNKIAKLEKQSLVYDRVKDEDIKKLEPELKVAKAVKSVDGLVLPEFDVEDYELVWQLNIKNQDELTKKIKELEKLCSTDVEETKLDIKKVKQILKKAVKYSKVKKNDIDLRVAEIVEKQYRSFNESKKLSKAIKAVKDIEYIDIELVKKEVKKIEKKLEITEKQIELDKVVNDINKIKLLDIDELKLRYNEYLEIEKRYNEYRSYLIKLEKFKKYNKWNTENTKLVKELKKLESDLLVINSLIVKADKLETEMLQKQIDQINDDINYFVNQFFTESIDVLMSLEKVNKKSKAKVKKFNLNIVFGGVEVDFKSLSGGQKDRVSLSIMLALANQSDSSLIMLDELLSSLDESTKSKTVDVLTETLANSNLIIVVDHGLPKGMFDNYIEL